MKRADRAVASVFSLVLAITFLSASALAELLSRADGAAYYDTVQDITWLSDASLALTSGYDTDVHMSWDDAQTFIATVNAASYLGVNSWRLPNMDVNGDAYLVFCSQATESECLDTELGYMGFVNGILPYSPGPFVNVTTLYWSSTDYNGTSIGYPNGYPCSYAACGNSAWRQGFPNAPDNYGESHNFVDKYYDGYGVWLVADGDVLGPSPVEVDAYPGREGQCKGSIPVVILGRDDFDVMQIDQATLAFEGLSVGERGNGALSCKVQDVNSDGFLDLVCQYENAATKGTLTGELLDGTPISGSDTICVLQ